MTKKPSNDHMNKKKNLKTLKKSVDIIVASAQASVHSLFL